MSESTITQNQTLFGGIKNPKPFLKWAGGKSQLLAEIEKRLPAEIRTSKFTYIEPFVGSGAVLFWMLSNFPNLEKAVINDVNADLINAYRQIKTSPDTLIEILNNYQTEFHELERHEQKKKTYYYEKRDLYNTRQSEKSVQAALFIFLNRTCFNGLYRVNSKNLFNVPMGSYRRPTICDAENIFAVHEALQLVAILNGDFEKTISYADKNSFYYFDPPYKPVSKTANFNSYADGKFDDNEQIRLKDFCIQIGTHGSKWMLSNSDVLDNPFLESIYSTSLIEKVKARRAINSKADKRGELNELIITNYSYEQTLQATLIG